MNTKNKYPWLRHIDFLVVDLLALLMKFVWKKLVLAGVVRISSSKSVSLFVIARRENFLLHLQIRISIQ